MIFKDASLISDFPHSLVVAKSTPCGYWRLLYSKTNFCLHVHPDYFFRNNFSHSTVDRHNDLDIGYSQQNMHRFIVDTFMALSVMWLVSVQYQRILKIVVLTFFHLSNTA